MEPIGTLQPKPPYHFALMLELLARYTHPTLDIAHDSAYWRVLRDGAALALLRVDGHGTLDDPSLTVSLIESTGAVRRDYLLMDIAHILGIQDDAAPFFTYARTDPALSRIVEPLVGLCWLRTPSVFEALMTTVIEQQIAWTAAQRAQRWLIEWGGQCVSWDGLDFYAFPTPEQVATATVEMLTPLKITFKRMRVIIDIARQIGDGQLNLERLRDCAAEEAYEALTALKGIGHWTAAWTLQRARGWHNYVGHNDVALQAAVNHYFYGENGRISAEKVRETFEKHGKYAGMAAHYTILRWVLDRYEQNPNE